MTKKEIIGYLRLEKEAFRIKEKIFHKWNELCYPKRRCWIPLFHISHCVKGFLTFRCTETSLETVSGICWLSLPKDGSPSWARTVWGLSLSLCMHARAWVRFSVCLCPCVFGMYMCLSYYLCLTLLISYASLDTGISCSHLYRCCVFAYCSVVLFFIRIFKKDFFLFEILNPKFHSYIASSDFLYIWNVNKVNSIF